MSPEWVQLARDIGVTGMALVAVLAFFKGWVMTAHFHERVIRDLREQYEKRIAELTADRDDYKGMLRDAVLITKRTLDTAGAPSPRKDPT